MSQAEYRDELPHDHSESLKTRSVAPGCSLNSRQKVAVGNGA